MIFHAATPGDWGEALRTGQYTVSTRDRALAAVGFVHCSYEWQVERVADAIYGDVDELVLLVIDVGKLTVPVVDEPADGVASGELFPHVYGPIPIRAVAEVRPWRRRDGGPWRLDEAGAAVDGTAYAIARSDPRAAVTLRRPLAARLRAFPVAELFSYILGFIGIGLLFDHEGGRNESIEWIWLPLAPILIAFAVVVRVAVYTEWVRATDFGVEWRSLFRRRFVPWHEVDELEERYVRMATPHAQSTKCFVLDLSNGRSVVVRPSVWCGSAARQEFIAATSHLARGPRPESRLDR